MPAVSWGMSIVREETIFSSLLSSGWTNNHVNMRQTGRRKWPLITYVRWRVPSEYETQGWPVRLLCLLVLRGKGGGSGWTWRAVRRFPWWWESKWVSVSKCGLVKQALLGSSRLSLVRGRLSLPQVTAPSGQPPSELFRSRAGSAASVQLTVSQLNAVSARKGTFPSSSVFQSEWNTWSLFLGVNFSTLYLF